MSAWQYLTQWLGLAAPAAPSPRARPAPAASPVPGERVRTPDGSEGTVTRVWQRTRGAVARVVFTGPRGTWVALLDAERLVPATRR